ncbi:uncharacterized protein JCM6883_004196 [Sporobolomyces salmoneus]|uniref:uncharacterized protein n=1 Tax=Sporobolomyces salmoneus TaxID=183962 RepID=UPI003177F60C
MDEAVAHHQLVTQYNRIPSFSLAHFSETSDDVVLGGTYEGFQRHCYPYAFSSSLPSLLVRSQHSLRYLSVSLHQDLDLTSFTGLERLRLCAGEDWSTPVESVAQVLPPLSSLRTLVLTDLVGHLATARLLKSGELADSVPSRLANLSVMYEDEGTSFDAPLSFLRALPATSKLKRVNFLRYTIEDCDSEEEGTGRTGQEGIEWSEEGDLIGEYGKRGIRLSFDEEWLMW